MPARSLAASSRASVSLSQVCSAGFSHAAARGEVGRKPSVNKPTATVAAPSRMNSHCQPWKPAKPCISMMPVASGAPSIGPMAAVDSSQEAARPRRCSGIQVPR